MDRGEGVLINRGMVVSVDEVVWADRDIEPPTVSSSVEFTSTGWVLKDGAEIPFTFNRQTRLEVGSTYLLPGRVSDRFVPIVRGAMQLDVGVDGATTVSPDDGVAERGTPSSSPDAVREMFTGLSTGEIGNILSSTQPQPIADARRDLPPAERYEAVVAGL
jgi:hypothetical protein